MTDFRNQYNGNGCKAILDHLEDLESKVSPANICIVRALKDFRVVAKKCFGQVLESDFEYYIANFALSFAAVKIRKTPKAHILIDHVGKFCRDRGQALGRFSEQASESVHSDFKKIYANYSRDENKADYGKELFLSVLKYNSMHMN